MRGPNASDLTKHGESYYSLVLAVAKRAREICSDAEKNKIVLTKKPVKIAIEDFEDGVCTFKESEELTEEA